MDSGFPVVGIGASAGGLAAFEAFFSGMPATADPGMAFVLVQHLAPDHESVLTALIRRYTRMQVFEVVDGMVVQPNCAYIIPPNRDMALLNGTLQLIEPAAPRGQRLPIDFFFRSLAQDQRERAICIVLSGTGTDGTLGARAVKGEGGMVMAQLPVSTEYDGMPRSVIGTGLVDFELPPADMPAQLISYVKRVFGRLPRPLAAPPPSSENALKKLFVLLRAQTGHDFSLYKPKTTLRRIDRRMAVQQIESIDDYIRFAHKNPAEVDALFRDLLIGVTCFFRDPEAFLALESEVIPKLFADKPADSTIRVWTPGCSTGEEAYSIAILLQEQLESLRRSFRVQLFATDLDSAAITTARAAVYPSSIEADIRPDRLERYFAAETGGGYRIRKNIRDMLVFSEQDVIRDPPFSRLDLISCRNLLIYMGSELQRKLIPLFHYAMNPRGFLFLGTSETVGEFGDLFAVLDRKAKLYQRKPDHHVAQRLALGGFVPSAVPTDLVGQRAAIRAASTSRLSLREITEKALLQELAPVAALVNAHGDILYLHGTMNAYLELPPGEVGIANILKMAREGLRRELAACLHRSVATNDVARTRGLHVHLNGADTVVNLSVRQVETRRTDPNEPPLYLILMDESPGTAEPAGAPARAPAVPEGISDVSVAALRKELRAKEEYLQTANEELETSNEELKCSNEEMQSVNEELQSTNEELETSKEELQSVNEELSTVNVELQTKLADLTRANNDMNNLLSGTGIGTVFVDHQLRILRFTPAATRIINLILSDVGRPVSHIVSNLVGYDRLPLDVQEVLDSLVPREVEVQTRIGEWYSMRIQPYRTIDNVIEGAVVTFVDISATIEARHAQQAAEVHFRSLFDSTPKCALLQDRGGRIIDANAAALRLFGLTLQQFRDPLTSPLHWRALDEAGRPLAQEQLPWTQRLRFEGESRAVTIGLHSPRTNSEIWICIQGVPQSKLGATGPHAELLMFDEVPGRQSH
ncbi:chemotaxis protein CheB [Paludibaculum fermentans]|uniref:chemotaxis protein CheB n=1 Tax=Paludibaculum fermentans TaxID=1473598 RepID=UPI003EBA95AE